VRGPATTPPRAPAGVSLLAALFFAAVTVLMTWPHAAHLSDRMNDLWDAKQNAWILHWDFWQTFHDPANLFQAPILHPARYALAFSENLYGGALFGFPLLALGTPVVANYNAVFLFSMAFSAWAAWLLARYATGDGLAALLAGLVYAFVPWRFAQLPHLNMQLGGFLCLLLYFLLRYLDDGRVRDLVLFAVCFALNLLSTFHYGLFSGFLIAAVFACEAVSGGREERRRMPMIALAAAVATGACAPFLIPYTITSKIYGMKRTLDEVDFYSARAYDFLSAGWQNKLYGAATKRWMRGEGDLFPGILPVLLAAGGLGAALRRPYAGARRAVLFLCIGVVGLFVCFGSRTPIYRFLFLDFGSVFRAIRAPIRAIVLCHIALGVLAAWGLSLLTARLGKGARIAVVALALLLVGFEYRAFPLELYAYDPSASAVDRWLRSQPTRETGAILEWPIGMPYDSDTMLRQAAHRKVLVNGHQSYYPPDYQRLVKDLRARAIAPEIWDEIARFDAGTLIFHSGRAPLYERVPFRTFLRAGLEQGRLRLWKSADDADGKAFVFRLGAAPSPSPPADPDSRRDFDALMTLSDADYAPPTGMVHLPAEGQPVAPGFWVHGWAVDDSGIARVEAATELGPAGAARIGTPWPGLVNFYPDLPGADRGGWGFLVPPLPPGPHTLRVTLVGTDGGKTVLERKIVVVNAPR